MTRNEAREALSITWRFDRVGELIALRELALVEAVRTHEASRSPNLPGSLSYADAQSLHSS